MDRSGSLPPDHRPTLKSGTRTCFGLVVGRDLLLWNMLVAYLSNDSLRAYFCLAGISASIIANCIGRLVPCAVQFVAVSIDRLFWSGRCLSGAAAVGFV